MSSTESYKEWSSTLYHRTLAEAFVQHANAYTEYYQTQSGLHQHLVEGFDEVERRRIVVILLASCLVEAQINYYLSCKMSTEHFNLVEMKTPVEKWVVVPSLFLPNYSFPKGEKLYQDLVSLFKRRNGIAHMKPEVVKDGKKVHHGNVPAAEIEHPQVMAWCDLPPRLVTHICEFDSSTEAQQMQWDLQTAYARGRLRR